MTDIHHWRRMIQPARTRTPAIEQEELDGTLPVITPRKNLKPKFSSYFTQSANTAGISKKESLSPQHESGGVDGPSWPVEDPYPDPDPDVLIDIIMCRILGSPYEGLHPRFNTVLLQIFEGFRSLSDVKQGLLAKADQESNKLSAMENVMQKSARQWSDEKQAYLAEIKRLELLLAKGERGLAEVTLARQDSLLHARTAGKSSKARKHDTLETIIQFMEKNKRVEEKFWGSQRATMRRRSPSADMRRLSKTLMSQTSSFPDLPPGTVTDAPSTLAEASYLEDLACRRATRTTSDPTTSFSEDDTVSAFSCAGDPLPDEANQPILTDPLEVDDFTAIKHMGQVLARRRNVDVNEVMPKLLEMFDVQPVHGYNSSSKGSQQVGAALVPVASAPRTQKNTNLMAKASGFFHKLKPQTTTHTAEGVGRRFSFEAGDDSSVNLVQKIAASRAASGPVPASAGSRAGVLRKSASTPLLAAHARQPETAKGGEMLSPVEQSPTEQSPTSSVPVLETRRASKIPTPKSGTLARPRQERESSESSLLTAIRHSGNIDGRSNSMSSSGYSSPSASRIDLPAGPQGPAGSRLREHTQALRGNALATAAASRAVENTQASVETNPVLVHGKRASVQRADMSEYRKENARPINVGGGHADPTDLHYGG